MSGEWESTIYDFTTCDWEKFVDVPITCNDGCLRIVDAVKPWHKKIYFADEWYIHVDTTPSKCCETFKWKWNKREVNRIAFRSPLPTKYSIKYYHKFYSGGDKMKNTLSICFDNGDTLSFTNIMRQRIYEHFVEIYHRDKKAFTTCI